MRQMPNFRMNARDRPQRWQRLCCRTMNFGLRLLFSIMALRAIPISLTEGLAGAAGPSMHREHYMFTTIGLSSPRNGMPSSRSSASAWSSLFVVVTTVMSIPWIDSTMS